jgi:hypothetical protein
VKRLNPRPTLKSIATAAKTLEAITIELNDLTTKIISSKSPDIPTLKARIDLLIRIAEQCESLMKIDSDVMSKLSAIRHQKLQEALIKAAEKRGDHQAINIIIGKD